MKTAFRNLAFAAASFLVLASCKKSVNFDDAAQAIPKNATSVTAMNLPSLMQKADFESVKQMDFYKEAIADADKDNPTVASIMRDPKKSGVDFTKNVYFVQDYNLGGLDGYGAEMTILMSLTDAAAFEAIVKSGKTDVKIETKDGVKYVINMPKPEPENAADGMNFVVKRSNSFVAWTDKMAVVGGGTGGNSDGNTDLSSGTHEGGDLPFLDRKSVV